MLWQQVVINSLLPFLEYLNNLYRKLDYYVTTETAPKFKDKSVPTMASQGPSYSTLDEVEETMEQKRRGLSLKPHYLSREEIEVINKKTEKAKKALAKKSGKVT